jgi:hypothetical protein
MPQGEILPKEVTARTGGLKEQDEQKPQRAKHEPVVAEGLLLTGEGIYGSRLNGNHSQAGDEVEVAHIEGRYIKTKT